MNEHFDKPPGYVAYIENFDYPTSLGCHKIYKVVPDAGAEADRDIRIIDESGEDYLMFFRAVYSDPCTVPSAVRKSLEMAAYLG